MHVACYLYIMPTQSDLTLGAASIEQSRSELRSSFRSQAQASLQPHSNAHRLVITGEALSARTTMDDAQGTYEVPPLAPYVGKWINHGYDGGLIFLSYFVSFIGCWTALELLHRRTSIHGYYNW